MSSSRSNWRGYLFVAPAAAYLVLFSLLPMAAALWFSLHRWHLLKPDHPFVGWDNYRNLLADPFFLNAIYRSVWFALVAVPLGVVTSLAVALLVHLPLRGVAVFRALFYMPAVSSMVAISMVWIWLFMPGAGAQVGLVNHVARLLGFAGATDFLNDTRWALPCMALIAVWVGLGPRMVIFLAGLQAIPQSTYEAAALDGCTGWRRLWHMTLPLLAPTTFFVVVTTTIAAFQFFTPIYMITRGGPRRTTDVVAYHIYKEAWHRFDMGTASAQTYVLFVMIALAAVVQFALMRRQRAAAGWA